MPRDSQPLIKLGQGRPIPTAEDIADVWWTVRTVLIVLGLVIVGVWV